MTIAQQVARVSRPARTQSFRLYFSGGAPNLFMLVPAEGFAYTKGAPNTYRRPDKADAVTRELASTFLKPGTSPTPRGIRQTCRFACWPWRSFRKIGRPRDDST